MFFDDLPTLLAQIDRFNRGLSIFQWGLTGVGVAILLGAVALLFQKPSKDAASVSATTQRVVGIIVAALGLGVIAYGWLGQAAPDGAGGWR